MVKPVAKAEINNLVKGILTEPSLLNFPPDATRDEQNFELNINGSRNRRQGIDFETPYQLRSTGYTASQIPNVATSYFRWLNAGNNPNLEFLVFQVGSHVDIFEVNDLVSLSYSFKGTVTLTGVNSATRFSYASIDGDLVIAAGTSTVHVIEWDGSSLQYSTGSILVRDLWGMPGSENNDLYTRPSTGTSDVIYNLRNQGWGIPRKDSAGSLADPIAVFNGQYGKFPANSETVYTGLQYQAKIDATPFERIFPTLYDDTFGLNEQAAKGYFIIDALKRGTSRATEEAANRTRFPSLSYSATTFPQDTTTGGATVAVEYAGRVFFGGFNGELLGPQSNSPNLSNYLFFSQVVKSKSDIFKCYQVGDPTSRESSDLVDTDGGFIRISGAKKILALKVLSNNLFVIADNGVWVVIGGGEYGFTATNYRVDKISTSGGMSDKSIVEVSDQVYFWGEEGIFQISKNQFGDWTCNNISSTTIQTLYDSITYSDKGKAVGVYDKGGKKVRWMYNINQNLEVEANVEELVFDLVLGAFTRNKIYNLATDSPRVIGYALTPSSTSNAEPRDVVISTDDVVVGTDTIQIQLVTELTHLTSVKFITLYSTVSGNVGYTFSQYRDIDFRDWKSVDGVGVDARAYMLIGSMTAGDSSVFKQVPYIIMHFLRTEEGVKVEDGELVPAKQSSCLVRSQWNWANSIESGNWGTPFQAYKYRRPQFIVNPADTYDNGFETVVTKNKLRGRGRALALHLETEPFKDCIILGWNLSLTGNSLA